MIPESNRASNCNIFDLVRKTSDISYRGSLWHGTMRSESENLVKNYIGNNIFKNAERENNFEVEKLGAKNSENWNHTDSILIGIKNISTWFMLVQITLT